MKKVFLILSLLTFVLSLNAEKIKLITEEYPPYNYTDGQQILGVTTDIVQELFLRAKIDYELKVYPWTRGYNTVLKEKNTGIFSITFTEERKPLFKWVGPIVPTTVSVIAKKDKGIKISSPEDFNSLKVGVVKDDIGEVLLKSAGVNDDAFQEVSSPAMNAKKINADRIDVVAYEENVMKWVLKSEGFNLDDYEVVYTLKEGELYLAFNKETSDEIIDKCQKIIDEMKTDGTFTKFINKYLK